MRRILRLACIALVVAAPAFAQPRPVGGGGAGTVPSSAIGDSGHAVGWNGSAWYSQAITGGSAAAGGLTTQVQRNNGGAIDGISGVTSNGTNMTFASAAFLLSGSTSGTVTMNAPATGGGTLTLPGGTDTIAGLAATQAFTNKTYNGNTWTAGTGVLTLGAGKTFTASNTLTLAGTDGSTLNIGAGGTLGTNAFLSTTFAPLASPTFTGTVTIPNGGVLGTPTSVTLTNATGLVPSTGIAATGTPTVSTCLLGNNTWGSCASGGSGTVTTITAGNGIQLSSGPTCTTTCTAATTVSTNAQSTGYALLAADAGKLTYSNSGSAVAYSIAQANTTGFTNGAGWEVASLGAGTTTITAATSTFGNGLTTLLLDKGQYALFASDSTNYPITAVTLPVVPSDGVMGNFTGATNYPKWAVIPTCSTGSSALTYNTSTHAFGCNTISGSGTVNSGTSGQLATYASTGTAVSGTNAGTGVITALGNNLSAAGGVTTTVASGTSALGTSAIASGACATVVTTSATNTATTDVINAGFNGDPTAVTGYAPATTGMLTIIGYPSTNNVNFKVCNNTNASVTPGAITLNWRVVR